MDSGRGKKTRASSKAGNAAPNASAQGVPDAPTQPAADTAPVAAAALRAAPSKAGDRGAARESGRQRRSAQSLREKTEVRAPRTCAKRASLCAEAPAPQASAATVLTERQSVPLEAQEPPEEPVACLPKAGSRSRKGARSSCTEQRPPLGPSKELCPAGAVQVPNVSQSEVVARGSWNSKEVLDKLRLKRDEISVAAEIVNKVVDQLLQRLNRVESEFKRATLLNTGSYYERVKISAPDEFDVMFKLEVPRVTLEEYPQSDAHYFVKFKRNPQGSPLDQFLGPDRRLLASKMLSKFRKIITEEVKNITDVDVAVEKKRRGCPAVTLIITQPREISVDLILALQPNTSWPACTQRGLPIDDWLGPKNRRELRKKPFYLVPKHAKEGNSFQEETWRLSFSNIEKDILSDHGQNKLCCHNEQKCCRKDCLKLMKYLLEQLKKKFENQKKLDKFCSYHVKTAFFHTCTKYPGDDKWDSKNVSVCFNNCVEYFLCCLRTECLNHYFIPTVNLFSQDQIDKKSKDFLLEQIEYERNNGYPVFSEF